MAIYHRKLLQEHISNKTTTLCSDCGTTCPYDCNYVSIYWPPESPQIPPSSNISNNTPNHMSPYLIIIVSLVASFILFVSYYLIIIRYCARFRQQPTTQRNQDTQDFMNHDQQPELDHPIWYITTIGLQPAVINSIKVVKFKKVNGMIEKSTCSVCLSEFEHDESLRLLPKCNHLFHIRCIDTWLLSHKNCPLCRADVVSQSNDENPMMEDAGNDGETGLNHVQESENSEDMREMRNVEGVQEQKTEHETVITLRWSFSMDSSAEIGSTDSNLANSSTGFRNLNDIRDSRSRRMMIMRSFSDSGRSNL